MRSKRERVLVGLAVLAALYGAYTLLSGGAVAKGRRPGDAPPKGSDSDEFVRYVGGIQARIRGATIPPLQKIVVSRALEPWPDDLILAAPLPSELIEQEERRLEAIRKAAEDADEARRRKRDAADRRRKLAGELRKRFVYSGYAYLGGVEEGALCAVLNGVVYKQGEELEGGGHVVKSITPAEVVIVSSEQGIEVTIPITE